MSRPRILFVSETAPLPADTGARQRTNVIARALAGAGDLELLLLTSESIGSDELCATRERFGPTEIVRPRAAGTLPPWSVARPLGAGFVDRAARALDWRHPALVGDPSAAGALEKALHARRFDLVACRYLGAALRARADDHPPAILDLDDLEPQMLRSAIDDPSTSWWRRRIIAARLAHLQRHLSARLAPFAALTVSSEGDARCIPDGRVAEVLPNIPYAPEDDPIRPLQPSPDSAEIIVVASWYYPPNFLGLERFLQRCWPAVRARVPHATLNVVGGSIRPAHRERWSAVGGVRVTGFVKDLRSEYARAALAIAPIYHGGGTKIKVLECMAYGRPCVATEHAHRGYERLLPSGEALMVARGDEAFADACATLLLDTALRSRLAERGAALVAEHFSFERVEHIVGELVGLALAQRGRV